MPAQINCHELQWLDAYRQAIREQHPDAVVKMLLFSREGMFWNRHDYTDLNILLVVGDDAEQLQRPLRMLGYSLSDPPLTFPSIMTLTESEMCRQSKMGSRAIKYAERHGVSLSCHA